MSLGTVSNTFFVTASHTYVIFLHPGYDEVDGKMMDEFFRMFQDEHMEVDDNSKFVNIIIHITTR